MNLYHHIIAARVRRLRPYYPHLGALAGAITLALVISIFKVAGEPPVVDTADRWPFPKWAPYKAGQLRQASAAHNPLTLDPTKAKVEPEKRFVGPPWRFIGTLQDGKTRIAVIELDQGKRIQRVSSGGTLPNGGLIKSVDVSQLTYDEGGVEKVLKLFGAAKTDGLSAGNGKN